MRVKSCVASDGSGHVINLSDEYGCVLRPKMISRFLKARAPDEKATVITYAFFHAFKFPDALSVHIKCKVEICRHGCLDHCQASGNNERHDIIEQEMIESNIERENNQIGVEPSNAINENEDNDDIDDEETSFYEEIADAIGLKSKNNAQKNAAEKQQQQHQHGPMIQEASETILHHQKPYETHSEPLAQAQMNEMSQSKPQQLPLQKEKTIPEVHEVIHEVHEETIDDILPKDPPMHEMLRKTYLELKKSQEERFPQGPRTLSKDRIGKPPVAGPRSLKFDDKLNLGEEVRPFYRSTFVPANKTYRARNRRSVVVSDRKARSADIGVTGIYDVISEADLQFSPREGKQEAVTVFQGKIAEDVVYGICMPVSYHKNTINSTIRFY